MPRRRQRLLIAGCGDLGNRIPPMLQGWQVCGLRRNVARLGPDIVPFGADLSDPASLDEVAGFWDAVIYTATPAARTPEGYRQAYVDGLRNLTDRIETPRLVMVSSTAVYGQDEGEWVAEDTPPAPKRFNGEILLEAENLAHAAGGIVVRFSGIYGPGREHLMRKVKDGPVACRREPPIWTNRIHADDCATALAHLVELDAPERLYVASDVQPAPRWDVLAWLAERLAAPGPIERQDGAGQGKRVCADRLLATGLELRYPDFRAGYGDILERTETSSNANER